MKIIIIEDELPALKRISKLVKDILPKAEILGTADTIEGAVSLFKTFPDAQLALMDIELADGQSFEVFNRVEVKIPIIFTTAYDEFALKAFKVNSIDYLLKPIDAEELKQALDKLSRLQQVSPSLNLNQLLQSINQKSTEYKQRFLVKMGQKYLSIGLSEIAYFHASEKLVYLVTKEQRKYIIDYTLDELEQMVDPHLFFRLNRQYLSHIESIESISSYFNGKLKIQLKPVVAEEILVSRERASDFKQWLNQ
jgi:two-component system, LytTR family, response regulator LytT